MMKEEIPSRRVVLRGALAVGCSLFVPIALLQFSGHQREFFRPDGDQESVTGKRAVPDKAEGRAEVRHLHEFHRRVEYLQAG